MRPVRWTPTTNPGLSGPFARNEDLQPLDIVAVAANGPEDVAIHPDGDLYTGVEDGRILRIPGALAPDADEDTTPETLARTGGRVGGIEVDGDSLVCCDYYRGLLRVSLTDGEVEVLVDEVDGAPLRCTNNASVDPDGRIWFSSSSDRWDLDNYRTDVLEGQATGRLLVHDPRDGSTEVVLDGLGFANGVAVTGDGSAVLVANSMTYDIQRVWLAGPGAGTDDVFVEGLPCALDNLSIGEDGQVWAACPVPRNKLLDLLSPRAPWLRRIAATLPEALVPAGPEVAWALAFDPDSGEVVENLQTWGAGYGFVTGVREHAGTLWLTSLHGRGLGRFRLPR